MWSLLGMYTLSNLPSQYPGRWRGQCPAWT
jgi:hypothetical protein